MVVKNLPFLISNDFDTPLELLIGNYSRRWRVENVIAEAVKFFNLNMLSSPILIKIHFDIVMTMIASRAFYEKDYREIALVCQWRSVEIEK